MSELKGWHRGEKLIQQKLNHASAVAESYTWISGDMPEQHRVFHSTRLPFVPMTTLDADGRPWGSILAGSDGQPGFIQSPSDTTLTMDVRVWEGDPWLLDAGMFAVERKMLAAGIGIEFPTRRRNKFAGWVSKLDQKGDTFRLEIKVNQAIGNCPKYINVRDLVAHPTTSPKLLHRQLYLQSAERLPEDVISFINESDTVFLGSSYVAAPSDERDYPSHVGMNQRGGRPGFVRVVPSDGRTVVLPDYSGNRLMTSLGNIEATPLASLTFVSFTTGTIAYLTGDARTLTGPAAQAIMPLQNTITTVYVTGYVVVHDALPVRQCPGTPVHRSPYSPPIRLLAEESSATLFDHGTDISAMLTRIEMHSPSVASFTWEPSQAVYIKPGQAAILDFTPLLGASTYQHMAPSKPTNVNDDRIRTWTVSSAHLPDRSDPETKGTNSFTVTMRLKPDGLVTGALFTIAHRLAEARPEMLPHTRPLELNVRLVGIQGDFVLPESTPKDEKSLDVTSSGMVGQATKELLWIAGGIGLTPFMSMLSAVAGADEDQTSWDIVLILSTREPDVLLRLLSHSLQGKPLRARLQLTLHVFSDKPIPDLDSPDVVLVRHQGRMSVSFFTDSGSQMAANREVYVCGPEPFERTAVDALVKVGVQSSKVRREGFGY